MKGLLSDDVRDIIAVVGLLLAILQTIIALLSVNSRAALFSSADEASAQGMKPRRYAFQLKPLTRESKEVFSFLVKGFLVLTLLVLLVAYLITPINPFEEAEIGWAKGLALYICFILVLLQSLIFASFLVMTEEKLFTEEERSGNNPKVPFFHTALNLLLFFLFLAGLSYLKPEASWLQLSLSIYSAAGLFMASILLFWSTVFGFVYLIKGWLKR
jgi:hypothetical protein